MEIIYKPNKKNILKTLAFLSVFVAIGFLFIIKSEDFTDSLIAKKTLILSSPISFQILGLMSLIISFLFFIGNLNIFFSKYALMISEKGFINNTSLANVGLIIWDDIYDVKLKKEKNSSSIFIYAKNEKKYYRRIKNPIIKFNTYTLKKSYKASFVIDPHKLAISDDELFEIFKKYAKL